MYAYCGNAQTVQTATSFNKNAIQEAKNNDVFSNSTYEPGVTKASTFEITAMSAANICAFQEDEVNIEQEHSNQMIRFDYSKNPGFNLFTSFRYTIKIEKENGLPSDRTFEGVWFELVGHYIIYKLDVLNLTNRDDIADIGNYRNDNNAMIWECVIHGIMQGMENAFYDYY